VGWGHIQPAAVSLVRGWRPPTSGAKDALWSTRAHIYFTALLGGEWFCSSAPLPMCDIGSVRFGWGWNVHVLGLVWNQLLSAGTTISINDCRSWISNL